jgi:hypothetical protein
MVLKVEGLVRDRLRRFQLFVFRFKAQHKQQQQEDAGLRWTLRVPLFQKI